MEVKKVFQAVIQRGASDLHLCVGLPPIIRVHGNLQPLSTKKLHSHEVHDFLKGILVPHEEKLTYGKNIDLGGEIEGVGRYRVHIYYDRQGICAAFRLIPEYIKSLQELGLPAIVEKTCSLANGLIIISGPAGSGKSTTLASIINQINITRSCHIVTLEDPIEFIHHHKRSLLNQRQIGVHVKSFSQGLRNALREDPDVILVGEMRDLETIRMAVSAAETGHLVFATLHTRDTSQAINRMVDVFDHEQQAQIRTQLADSLRMVVSQLLIPSIDGDCRYLATEVLIVTHGVRNLIRENKTYQIKSAIENGRGVGMHTFEGSFKQLLSQGKVSQDMLQSARDAAHLLEESLKM